MRGALSKSDFGKPVIRPFSTRYVRSTPAASACSAPGSRSGESCSALKPRTSLRPPWWHALQSLTPGIVCERPPPLAERELLPQARADRKHPGVRIGAVDGAARRQRYPAALRGAVGPERILRREGEVARIDLKGGEIRIEPGLLQGLRRLARSRLRNRVDAREQRDDEDQDSGQTPPSGAKILHPGSDSTHRILFSEDSAEGGLPHRG